MSHSQRPGQTPAYAGYLFILIAAGCWGLIGSVARLVMDSGMDPLEIAFWRAALSGVLFTALAASRKELRLGSALDLLAFAAFGATSIAGFFGSYQYAVLNGGAALAAVLLYTAPAWVAVCSRIFFKENFTTVKVAAIAISLCGVFLICLSDMAAQSGAQGPGLSFSSFTGKVNSAGILFGLLAGFLYSTHYIFTKKYLIKYPANALYGYCMLFGALALYPFVNFTHKGPKEWAVVLFIGLVCTFGAYMAYARGLRLLSPTRAAVLATMEPVIAIIAAWLLWGESFRPAGWFGSALVIGAVIILVKGTKNEQTET